MTSPASQQNNIPATNTTATAAPSYASAAGAPKKPAQAPVVATGSPPPVVVGSTASPAQNAKAASPAPVNGKTAVTPALPAVARGTSSANGSDHSRKSSVTMATNAPNSFVPNGGAKPGIQFGFESSPAIPHSTPQSGNSAPIAIPPANNARVPSPINSPAPIPMPSASGGRVPTGLQQSAGQVTFGSLGSDGERHFRQGSAPHNPNNVGPQSNNHFRRDSNHSFQNDNQGGQGRGNFSQGGRGRGGFNSHNNSYNNQMGYPPNNQFRPGPGQGRGMPPAFQPQSRNMPYPNSPQPNRSPALVSSIPNTPNMPPATMQPNMSMQTPPQYHYAPPIAPQHQQVQSPFPAVYTKPFSKSHKKHKAKRAKDKSGFAGIDADSVRELLSANDDKVSSGFGGHMQSPFTRWHDSYSTQARPDGVVRSYPVPDLSEMTNLPPSITHTIDLSPENGQFELLLTMRNQNFGFPPPGVDPYGRPISYGYNNMGYMGPPQGGSPGYNQQFVPQSYHQPGHSMSRTPSQPERPASATPQNQPVIVSSTSQKPSPQLKPGANNFVKPRKSAAIQIKNAAGEVVDISTVKQPASPAPTIAQSKTPPVASAPTPPPKSSAPTHARADSHATPKTAKEIQDELKEKIKQATKLPVENKPQEEQPTSASTEPAVEKPSSQLGTSDVSSPPKDEASPAKSSDLTNKVEDAPEEIPKEAPKEDIKETPKEETKEAPKEVEEAKPAEASTQETEDEEMERMIREMEEADAKREKEEEEHQKKRDAEKAAKKKQEEENKKISTEEADRKLREQEREMERLEEEKEKRRQQGESSGKTLSVAEALAQARGEGSAKPEETPNVEAVTEKLADVKLGDRSSPSTETAGSKAAAAEKRGKPAALNLAPIITKPVEPPQPSAALQSLKSARFLKVLDQDIYPEGIKSPNPALNAAVAKKGKTFKYDASFLLQFQKVFVEQPSLEFHQQVKSLIGDGDGGRSASARGAQTPGSARQASRGGGFPMGVFNPPPGRTIPPGTTSADRFAMSSGSLPRPQVNPMASFRSSGAFPTSTSMSRTSSQTNNLNSPRQSSRSTRGSRRNDYNPKDAQAAKTMPLTAGQEVKPIAVSASGWKPSSIGNKASSTANATGYLDPEMVQRKVKAALNKMTPEKFDKIADQILTIASQSKDESDGRTLRQVIQLTFEKATDEAHWASMYAKFCKRMLENMSPEVRDERIKDKNGNIVSGGNLFRKYLLNRCQEEFERGWTSNLPDPKEVEEETANKKPGEAVMLSDEYYIAAAAKRRGLGLVQFIGELYKLGMLTERIMHECVRKLVDYKGIPDEAEIESLSKLLRTIGANLDATDKGRPMMDAYFQRIQTMADLPELPSRMRFMLMDVLDLRRGNWHSKEANKGPKTLEEVRAEAEAAQAARAQESARNSQRGGGGGRPPAGRGDARNFSAGYSQQTSNQVGIDDLRRLKGSAGRTSSQNVTLGPASMFSSRSNSGRRMPAFGRPGEDSGASSRTGTPPVRDSHSNAFSLLANMETENPASPPSTSASPSLSKAVPDSDKKESD
ncbi:hypothetical protein S40288_00149 [Stachybotrys chartarum IBT 40288]|nr:hypothetical protein S40288_00149 [Stachybotrys chartarum IBT 40288]